MAALRNREMGNILNLIYDDEQVKSADVSNYMDTYLFINNYKLQHIDKIDEVNGKKCFYLYFHQDYFYHRIKNFGGLPLSQKVINELKKYEHFNVIFINDSESDKDDAIILLEDEVKKNGLNPNQFYILNWNQNLNESKIRHNSQINVHTMNRGDCVVSNSFSKFKFDFKKEHKEYFFMNHNRNVKSHRFFTLCLLKKYNLLNDTDWSWLRGYQLKERFMDDDNNLTPNYYFESFNSDFLIDIKDEIKYFSVIDKKKSVYEESYEIDKPPYDIDWDKMWSMNTYSNSYINIVGETNFENTNVVIVCEKSYIPFYYYQMPIIVASPYHIKKMRELYDLDFFDDLINHGYDNECDNNKRLLMIVNELKRLHDKKDEVIDFYFKNEHRFIENKNKILNMRNRNKIDSDFFQKLINE